MWPYGITCGADGYVYVTDASQQKVKKFTAQGALVKEWGSFGTLPGQFYKPKGIAQDQRGYLYVIDFGNHRGQIFTSDGKFVNIFGEGELRPESSSTSSYSQAAITSIKDATNTLYTQVWVAIPVLILTLLGAFGLGEEANDGPFASEKPVEEVLLSHKSVSPKISRSMCSQGYGAQSAIPLFLMLS